MPLEALINPDTGGVIVAKPQGSIWGRCEVNAVVLLDDPALESKLTEAAAEHVVYPYAAWEEKEVGVSKHKTGVRHKRRELREISLVKVAVTAHQRKAMKTISEQPGILRAPHAQPATIAAVLPRPEPSKDGKIIVENPPPKTSHS